LFGGPPAVWELLAPNLIPVFVPMDLAVADIADRDEVGDAPILSVTVNMVNTNRTLSIA